MNHDTVENILRQKPSVHKLCYGGFIQETLRLKENVYAIPLKALGFESEANYAARYVAEVCGGDVEHQQLHTLIAQGERFLPVIALVVLQSEDTSPELMEAEAEKSLFIPEKIVGWSAGEQLIPFAYCIGKANQHLFKILPPHTRMRQRLGFGNTNENYSNQLSRMVVCAENDEHYLFALSLYNDTLAESNDVFKIARFFSCLECLAYKIKSKELPSRKAVKQLLGLEENAMIHIKTDSNEYRFDRIEVAGRLRDKLFHGIAFTEKDLNSASKHVFELIKNNPEIIANSLRDDCELEFALWANGASNGLDKK